MLQDLMGCGPGGGLAMGFGVVMIVLIPIALLFAIASMSKYLFDASRRDQGNAPRQAPNMAKVAV